ncbi:MAG: hypothetical protein AAF841_05330 [Pseudomonadota bacterium]
MKFRLLLLLALVGLGLAACSEMREHGGFGGMSALQVEQTVFT